MLLQMLQAHLYNLLRTVGNPMIGEHGLSTLQTDRISLLLAVSHLEFCISFCIC